MKILLVHLMSLGDCLMATTVARQIKMDYPDCILTWAISYKCKQLLESNPYVDFIWEIKYEQHENPYKEIWKSVKAEALIQQSAGIFDKIFFTQIYPDNLNNFDGTTRSSTFKNYNRKITVPIAPVISLSEKEINNVLFFAKTHELDAFKNVILFESAPNSNQSFINPDIAMRISREIVNKLPDTLIIITSNQPFKTQNARIIDASSLSFRENAELSKYCSFFIGCSSGITWLLTTEWAKKLPTLLLLSQPTAWYSFASLKYDNKYWGLNSAHVTETDCQNEKYISIAVIKYLNSRTYPKNFERLFKPSIKQIVDLYNLNYSINLRCILGNYKIRNNTNFVSLKFCFYLAEETIVSQVAKLVKKLKSIIMKFQMLKWIVV